MYLILVKAGAQNVTTRTKKILNIKCRGNDLTYIILQCRFYIPRISTLTKPLNTGK